MSTERKTVRLSEMPGSALAVRRVRARFDNAETTDENRNHWAGASNLSADALATPWRRAILRARCRYECANNSWAKGIRDTLANDCIGTGPRLQMLTDDPELNTEIEQDFWLWTQETDLPRKLRTMRAARVESGEAFGLLATNPGLSGDVKLDLTFVEPEQVTDPFLRDPDVRRVDGIEYDGHGNAVQYYVLRHHPGDLGVWFFRPADFDTWPSRFVLHYFRPDRPGQRRGVPDLTPAIDQFAELRRYSKAVIAAAEAAADHALVVYTDAPADPDSEVAPEAMDTFELRRRMATVLPEGYRLGQVEAQQPTTTYKEFVDAKLAEIARCLNVPFFVAALDAAGANMSASYVVGQKYDRMIQVDRAEIEVLLNRLLDQWLTEWLFVRRPRGTPVIFSRVWQWDAVGSHADPVRVATARATDLASGLTNIPREYARQGLDWEEEQEADAKSLGMTIEDYRARLRDLRFGSAPAGRTPENSQETGNGEGDEDEENEE